MTIDEILRPGDVNLALRAVTKSEAIEEVLAQLHGDERVKDWTVLRTAVIARDAPAIAEGEFALCIAHGRTPAVRELVFAAGRSLQGVPCPEAGSGVQLFFVAGIPSAVDSEYLRLVGAIARVCSDPEDVRRLLDAADGEAFVEILARATQRLD